MHDVANPMESMMMGHILQSTERITYSHINQLRPSDKLAEIMDPKTIESFFHMGQQTNRMLADHNRRSRLSHENHRKCLTQKYVEKEILSSAGSIMFTEVDPFEVTLTMQISNLDNDLYKKSIPESLPEIMRVTDTIIRFPDQGVEGLAACQILIRGTPKNVEVARTLVRSLTAVSMSFTAESNTYGYNFDALTRWLEEKLPKLPKDLFFKVVPSQRKQYFEKTTIQVTGSFKQEEQIAQCINQLRSDLFNALDAEQILILTEITIPHTQMENFTGGERPDQMIAIARVANVFLHFMPQPPINRFNKPNFFPYQNFIITGTDPQGVFHALKIMTALQPIQLSFNVMGNDLVHLMERTQTKKIYDDKTQVHMVLTPSIKQIMRSDPPIHFVCLTAQEHNMGNIYHTMRTMFKKKMEAENKVPLCKTPNFMHPVVKQLQVLPRLLDVQNCEFPEVIMVYQQPDKGDTYLLERSSEIDDMENAIMLPVPMELPPLNIRNMRVPNAKFAREPHFNMRRQFDRRFDASKGDNYLIDRPEMDDMENIHFMPMCPPEMPPMRAQNMRSNGTRYSRDSPFAKGRQLDRRVDVDHVLFSINCDKYLDFFRKAGVTNLPHFQTLEEKDLQNIGVGSSLDRNTIMEYIYKLREAQLTNPMPSSSNH